MRKFYESMMSWWYKSPPITHLELPQPKPAPPMKQLDPTKTIKTGGVDDIIYPNNWYVMI